MYVCIQATYYAQNRYNIMMCDHTMLLQHNNATEIVRKYLRARPFNINDPIAYTPLRLATCIFKVVHDNGRVTGYDAEVIARYMHKSHKFSDPVTTVPFTDVELWRLDCMLMRCGIFVPSLLVEKNLHACLHIPSMVSPRMQMPPLFVDNAIPTTPHQQSIPTTTTEAAVQNDISESIQTILSIARNAWVESTRIRTSVEMYINAYMEMMRSMPDANIVVRDMLTMYSESSCDDPISWRVWCRLYDTTTGDVPLWTMLGSWMTDVPQIPVQPLMESSTNNNVTSSSGSMHSQRRNVATPRMENHAW